MLKKILISAGVFVLFLIAVGTALFLIYVFPVMSQMKQTTITKYDPNFTVVLNGGGNSGILTGDSTVLVIDTKMDEAAEALAKMVKDVAGSKRIIVVNTHIHTDHVGGNKYFEGDEIIAGGNYKPKFWERENGKKSMPTLWLQDSMVLHIGNETVTILNLPWPAHTQSDVVVYLHNRKVLFTGDVVLNHSAPAMFGRYKSDPYGYLKAFDYLEQRFDIAKVVPGHGAVGGVEVINNYKDFFLDMKVASVDPAREKELLAKYKDWKQIPLIMSPAATEGKFKK